MGLHVGREASAEGRKWNRPRATFHVWSSPSEGAWPCVDGPEYGDYNRPPAACGTEGIDTHMYDLRRHFDSVHEALTDVDCCDGCAQAVADHLGLRLVGVNV